ncbi:hypothetical protein ACSBR2_010785 [Camellia fascicularis]
MNACFSITTSVGGKCIDSVHNHEFHVHPCLLVRSGIVVETQLEFYVFRTRMITAPCSFGKSE